MADKISDNKMSDNKISDNLSEDKVSDETQKILLAKAAITAPAYRVAPYNPSENETSKGDKKR